MKDYEIMWATDWMKNPYANEENIKLIEELKNIWKESFNDDDNYINLFFRYKFEPKYTIIAVHNDRVIGATYLLPAKVESTHSILPVVFGYALGILKDYRGFEISKKIIDYIYKYCNDNNVIFIAYPANEKLAQYYETVGLKHISYMKLIHDSFDYISDSLDFIVDEISPEYYAYLRNNFFKEDGFIQWDNASVAYALLENRYCGGFSKKVTYHSKEYAIFGRIKNNELYILEITVPDDLLFEILHRVAFYFRIKDIVVYLPVTSKLNGRVKNWIMGYNAKAVCNGYCNLLLN